MDTDYNKNKYGDITNITKIFYVMVPWITSRLKKNPFRQILIPGILRTMAFVGKCH